MTLADLLKSIEYFVNHLDIYTRIHPVSAMNEMVVKTLVELTSTLALVTKELKQRGSSESILAQANAFPYLDDTVEPLMKIFGEKNVEAVLRRLDRLTQDEARMTAAQTLGVIYGIVQNMREIMDGKQTHSAVY